MSNRMRSKIEIAQVIKSTNLSDIIPALQPIVARSRFSSMEPARASEVGISPKPHTLAEARRLRASTVTPSPIASAASSIYPAKAHMNYNEDIFDPSGFKKLESLFTLSQQKFESRSRRNLMFFATRPQTALPILNHSPISSANELGSWSSLPKVDFPARIPMIPSGPFMPTELAASDEFTPPLASMPLIEPISSELYRPEGEQGKSLNRIDSISSSNSTSTASTETDEKMIKSDDLLQKRRLTHLHPSLQTASLNDLDRMEFPGAE
jgi:hypothetical protein